ncbi:MAG: DMT family transporter [Deltaproteobacteria bacterium]|nr:DMT family transporter [Deltaproteobacteria bacterium]
MSRQQQSHLLLHLIILLWACTGLIGQQLPWPSEIIVWYRLAIALIMLTIILHQKKTFHGLLLLNRQEYSLAIAGGLTLALHWWCFFTSIKWSSVSLGLVCLSTTPFLTTLMQMILYRKKAPFHELICSMMTITGILIIFNTDLQSTSAIIAGLFSSFLNALFNIINGRLSRVRNAILISWLQLAAGLLTASLTLVILKSSLSDYIPSEGTEILSLLFLGLICTAMATVGCLWIMKELSPYTVGLSANLEPVYGIMLAMIVRGEQEVMSEGFYLGAALIFASVVANTFMIQRKFQPQKPCA